MKNIFHQHIKVLGVGQELYHMENSRKSFLWKRWQSTWELANMPYPDFFPKHFIGISINILTMPGCVTHVIAWKIREILLQIFVWIVDLKAREYLTGYLRKDIKCRQANIGMHMLGICYRSRRKLKVF